MGDVCSNGFCHHQTHDKTICVDRNISSMFCKDAWAGETECIDASMRDRDPQVVAIVTQSVLLPDKAVKHVDFSPGEDTGDSTMTTALLNGDESNKVTGVQSYAMSMSNTMSLTATQDTTLQPTPSRKTAQIVDLETSTTTETKKVDTQPNIVEMTTFQSGYSSRSTKRTLSQKLRKGFSGMLQRSASRQSGGRCVGFGQDTITAGDGITYKRAQSGNTNMPNHYAWLEEVFQIIVDNDADSLNCVDVSSNHTFTPLFFVIGGCPNYFCGMQVVMYGISSARHVDFWWVKPSKEAPSSVERNTLNRHAKGPYKNDPGRSKAFYQPLADIFSQAGAQNGVRFGIEDGVPGKRSSRAYLEQQSLSGQCERLYLYLVWQEDWSSNPFARTKYVKGRIVYQKSLEASVYYTRQYCIQNGTVFILDIEEGPSHTVVPGEELKVLWDWVPGPS